MAKTYETYKDSGIAWVGEIPSEWTICRLSILFNEHKNKNLSNIENNLLSLSYGLIKQKDINTSEGLLPKSFDGYNIIEKNDIVFRLTDLQNDKKSLRSALSHERGIITSAYTTIRLKDERCSPAYFNHFFRALDECKVLYGIGSGVRQGMNFNDLAQLRICCPSKIKQRAIASFLDQKCGEIDSLIALQKEMIKELQAYKQSVIAEVVTKGIDPNAKMKDSGVEWIGEIPSHWEVLPHKRVMHKIKLLLKNYDNELVLSLTMRGVIVRDFSNGGKFQSTFDGYQIVFPGNLLLCLFDIDVTPRCVGLIKCNGITSPAYSQFELSERANESYYNYLLRYMDDYKVLLHLSKNLRSSLTESEFGSITTVLPPLAEQRAIANYLDTKTAQIDSLIAIKQEKITELKDYKKSIIYEYVTGKKKV